MIKTPIEIGGKKRHLRYDMNALSEIERRVGSLKELDPNNVGMGDLRTMIWAGLLHEDRELDEWTVGSWVDLQNVEVVSESVAQAFKEQFGAENEKKVRAARKATGSGKK